MVRLLVAAHLQIFQTLSTWLNLTVGLNVSNEIAQPGLQHAPRLEIDHSIMFLHGLRVWNQENNHAQFAHFSRVRISRYTLAPQIQPPKIPGYGLITTHGVGQRVPLLHPLDATLRVNGKMANPTVTHRTVFKLIGRGHLLVTGMTFNATIQPTFMLPNMADKAVEARPTYRH